VPPALGRVACLRACTAGNLLAVGTSAGGLLVADVRSSASKVLFQAAADGGGKRRKAAGAAGPAALTGLAWSADGYQLAGLDAGGALRMWWMRAAAGGQAGGAAPPPPDLALEVAADGAVASGKQRVLDSGELEAAAGGGGGGLGGPGDGDDDDDGGGAGPSGGGGAAAAGGKKRGAQALPPTPEERARARAVGEVAREAAARARIAARMHAPAFHPAFTLTGVQPGLVAPQATGDVLRVTAPRELCGPVLPGLQPPPSRPPIVDDATAQFIMPPAAHSTGVQSQARRLCTPARPQAALRCLRPPPPSHRPQTLQTLYTTAPKALPPEPSPFKPSKTTFLRANRRCIAATTRRSCSRASCPTVPR